MSSGKSKEFRLYTLYVFHWWYPRLSGYNRPYHQDHQYHRLLHCSYVPYSWHVVHFHPPKIQVWTTHWIRLRYGLILLPTTLLDIAPNPMKSHKIPKFHQFSLWIPQEIPLKPNHFWHPPRPTTPWAVPVQFSAPGIPGHARGTCDPQSRPGGPRWAPARTPETLEWKCHNGRKIENWIGFYKWNSHEYAMHIYI